MVSDGCWRRFLASAHRVQTMFGAEAVEAMQRLLKKDLLPLEGILVRSSARLKVSIGGQLSTVAYVSLLGPGPTKLCMRSFTGHIRHDASGCILPCRVVTRFIVILVLLQHGAVQESNRR